MLPLQHKFGLTLVQRSGPGVRPHTVNACRPSPAIGQRTSKAQGVPSLTQRRKVELFFASPSTRIGSQVRLLATLDFV
eukprot:1196174-Prorocentrum_minimum.AAC.10